MPELSLKEEKKKISKDGMAKISVKNERTRWKEGRTSNSQ